MIVNKKILLVGIGAFVLPGYVAQATNQKQRRRIALSIEERGKIINTKALIELNNKDKDWEKMLSKTNAQAKNKPEQLDDEGRQRCRDTVNVYDKALGIYLKNQHLTEQDLRNNGAGKKVCMLYLEIQAAGGSRPSRVQEAVDALVENKSINVYFLTSNEIAERQSIVRDENAENWKVRKAEGELRLADASNSEEEEEEEAA